MQGWAELSMQELILDLPELLEIAENVLPDLAQHDQTALADAVAELRRTPAGRQPDRVSAERVGEALVVAARHRFAADASADAIAMLHKAHELARLTRDGNNPTRTMRAAVHLACEVFIRQAVATIARMERDESIDSLLEDVAIFVQDAQGEMSPQLRIMLHERVLRELEEARNEHADDAEFERRLVRNNITAVLGLSLPQRMRPVQEAWQEIARHVAPHALRFAEQEFALPRRLTAVLSGDQLDDIEHAVSLGDAGALATALDAVEEPLVSNLALRLDTGADLPWLAPDCRVNLRPGSVDPDWMRAKSALEHGDQKSLNQFRNLDFNKGRNPHAREWYAYALAVLGRRSDIHKIIGMLEEVTASPGFNPAYNSKAYWNLAVARSRVPALKRRALDALLPLLELERHPAEALDLGLQWAIEENRTDLLPRLLLRCRHHEAHLLAALGAARVVDAQPDQVMDPDHLRRTAEILANPDHEFPVPAEELGPDRLDSLVADFRHFSLLDAGIEWFRQRVTYPRESFSYKNWECLGRLYEFAGDIGSAWSARRRSFERTLLYSRKRNRPAVAGSALKRLLDWALHNGHQADALRELRKSWKDTSLTSGEVAVWEEKLGPTAAIQSRHDAVDDDGAGSRGKVCGGRGQDVTADTAQQFIDRLAPRFETVRTTRQLADLTGDAAQVLAAAHTLGRGGPATVGPAIEAILRNAGEVESGASETRCREIDAAMREQSQGLQQDMDQIPLELRVLAQACTRVVQGFAARLSGVPDLTITMPGDLRMSLDAPVGGAPVVSRLAVRLHNPATEPATGVRLNATSESEELAILTPTVDVGEVAPGLNRIVEFEVELQPAAQPAPCQLLIHVAYRSVAVNRAVYARGSVPVSPVGQPIPLTERFVTGAPVAADRVDLFHGRDRELTELKEAFAGGRLRRLYFVNGIRRVGKSSLMRHLGRVCAPEILTVMIDFDVDEQLNDLRLVRELIRKFLGGLHAMPEFADIDIPLPAAADFELDAPWTVFENAVRGVARQTGRRMLICLDELQELVARIADPDDPLGESMLSWLRGHAQRESDVLFVCTGSESFDTIKRRIDVRLWGNIQPYNVSFVNRSAMERIVTVPLNPDGVHWLPETLETLWDLTEGHPWVTQVLAEHVATLLNRERRRIALPGDVDRAADKALADANISDLWWNEEEGLVTKVHRQVAFLILKHQPRRRTGVTTPDLFQACARSGIQGAGVYVDVMAGLELLTYDESGEVARWRFKGGFLERYLEMLYAKVVSESLVDTSAHVANQPLGVFLDVENIKKTLLRIIDERPIEERGRLRAALRGDRLGITLLKAAARHGNPIIRWAVANWHVGYLDGDQMAYKQAGYQPDIAGADKADASDHILKEHIHAALRNNDLSAFVIGTGDGDYQAITQTLQSQDKYLVLWATRNNMSNAFGANLRSDKGNLVVEFLEDLVLRIDD